MWADQRAKQIAKQRSELLKRHTLSLSDPNRAPSGEEMSEECARARTLRLRSAHGRLRVCLDA